MATIIAAHVQTQDEAAEAADNLIANGFTPEKVSSFYVNPAGQHDAFALGGDHDKSTGAEQSDTGIAKGMGSGGVVGAIAGVAGTAVAGPIGPVIGALLGAHAGGLVGAMSSMKESNETDQPEKIHDYHAVPRRSGMLVAVEVATADEQKRAVDLLRDLGAENVERSSGVIVDGSWTDFDPLSQSMLVPQEIASTPHAQ